MNSATQTISQFGESTTAAVALPDQSLAHMSAFVALIESLELLENSKATETSLANLPDLTRKVLLAEIQTCLTDLRGKRRKRSSVHSTLARLKHDARRALDIESIAQHSNAP